MAMIPSFVRTAVDSWTPSLGHAYREARHRRAISKPVLTPFGFTLALPPSSLIGVHVGEQMASGEYERDEIRVFLQHLQSAAVCIDIGANIGLYTCLAASQAKRVIAVEPMAINQRYLFQNLVNNGWTDAEVYPCGFSSAPGLKLIYGGGPVASFLPQWHAGTATYSAIVPVTTLDIIAGTRFDGLPIVIKVDVEGVEFEVFKGAERTLRLNPKPVWIVEIQLNRDRSGALNDKFYETFEVFWRQGYQSSTADSSQQAVRPEDVSRWVANGCVDGGTWNYLFFQN
jgi:FkbM family methyltransferase